MLPIKVAFITLLCIFSVNGGGLVRSLVQSGQSGRLSSINWVRDLANRYGPDQVIDTPLGQVKGKLKTSRGGQAYYSFTGIPFAEKPQRFKVAEPVRPWDGILDATRPAPKCMQGQFVPVPILPAVSGQEDCLYVNVYYPAEHRCGEAEKLPVLFHIHGGAFIIGAGSDYDPDYLMDECIVYVSTNYRLGALGFLTTDDSVIPGNLGLKDALLALKWTRENIASFRGDKNSITLNGISAGAASVSHFIASPAAKGLFHRAIAQSGSSLCEFAVIKKPRKNAFRLGQLLNCNARTSEDLLKCLQAADARDITRLQDKVKNMPFDFDQVLFGPVIEPTDASEPFQTEHPYLRYKRGDVNRVPLITGVTKDEAITLPAGPILRDPTLVKELDKNWYRIAPFLYQFDHINISSARKREISDKIRQFYYGGRPIDFETAQNFTDSTSDRIFNMGMMEESLLYSKYAPVYQYVFTFKGKFSFASMLHRLPQTVVSHGDDAQYLFKTFILVPPQRPGSRELDFSHNLIKLWASFVKTGYPQDVWPNTSKWRPFKENSRETMQLEIPSEMKRDYIRDRVDFWQSLQLRELEFPELHT